MSDIKLPAMRQELIQYLKNLSDFEYQKLNWTQHDTDKRLKNDNFDYAVHFLYDDTDLATNPYLAIGLFLINADEAFLIKKLIDSIEHIFCLYGTNLTDDKYIALPEWVDVLAAAKNAMTLIR